MTHDDPVGYLAREVGVSERWARLLCRAGVRFVEEMRDWTLDDLRDVRWVGPAALRVLVPALREAGVPLPEKATAGAGGSVSAWDVFHYVITALVVVAWVLPNDRDVQRTTGRPDRVPVFYVIAFAFSIIFVVADLLARNWLGVFSNTVVAAMSGRILWHWWRRRRQGKPSRVLGLVTDVGHKLAVVNVPATGEAR